MRQEELKAKVRKKAHSDEEKKKFNYFVIQDNVNGRIEWNFIAKLNFTFKQAKREAGKCWQRKVELNRLEIKMWIELFVFISFEPISRPFLLALLLL